MNKHQLSTSQTKLISKKTTAALDEKPQFENYSNIWSTETGIKQIKYLKQNEEFEFTIVTKQNLDLLLYIYVSNNEEIQKTLDKKNKNYFTGIKINNNGLEGKAIFQDDGYLVLGIAYDDCWKIFVNGEEREKEKMMGCFLGVKLEKGEHLIEIKASVL